LTAETGLCKLFIQTCQSRFASLESEAKMSDPKIIKLNPGHKDDGLEPPSVLFKAAAARYIGVSVGKLIRWSDDGVIPCYEFMDRRAWRREDLDRFLRDSLNKKWTPHAMKNQKRRE
jgi:hypothetical protein